MPIYLIPSIQAKKTDIYTLRGGDGIFPDQVLDSTGLSVDLSEITMSVEVREYETGITLIPATIDITDAVTGMYSILIDDTTQLPRSRYVYSVFIELDNEKYKVKYGSLLVE